MLTYNNCYANNKNNGNSGDKWNREMNMTELQKTSI